jgi:hypothetical protein
MLKKDYDYTSDIVKDHLSLIRGRGKKPVSKDMATNVGFCSVFAGLDLFRSLNPNIGNRFIAVIINIDDTDTYLVSKDFGEYYVLDHPAFLIREISTKYDTFIAKNKEPLIIDGVESPVRLSDCINYCLFAIQEKKPIASASARNIAYTSLIATQDKMPARALLPLYNYNIQVTRSSKFNIVVHKMDEIHLSLDKDRPIFDVHQITADQIITME